MDDQWEGMGSLGFTSGVVDWVTNKAYIKMCPFHYTACLLPLCRILLMFSSPSPHLAAAATLRLGVTASSLAPLPTI